jgi:hypothetical protein
VRYEGQSGGKDGSQVFGCATGKMEFPTDKLGRTEGGEGSGVQVQTCYTWDAHQTLDMQMGVAGQL